MPFVPCEAVIPFPLGRKPEPDHLWFFRTKELGGDAFDAGAVGMQEWSKIGDEVVCLEGGGVTTKVVNVSGCCLWLSGDAQTVRNEFKGWDGRYPESVLWAEGV